MNEKNLNMIWKISLGVAAVVSFILAAAELFDFDLPDLLSRVLGLAGVVSIPALVWSSLQKDRNGK